MIKYLAYCRKSTDEPDRQILSIQAQIAEVKEFASRENLEIIEIIVESKTAKSPGRGEFNRMVKLLEANKAQGIVAWHPDRLARNSVDGGQLIYLLDTGKLLDLKFPSFWFDNTPQGKFMLNIAFGQSKYYVDNLSENVKRGNRQKIRRGEWPNKAPIGYLNYHPINQAKTIIVDSQKSKYIIKAFKMFATGSFAFIQIRDFLTDNKVFGVNKGNKIHLDTIRRILSNPFYYGVLKYKGEFFKGVHQSLISKKLFDQVQRVINHKCTNYQTHKSDFYFVKLATCGECGSAITAEKHRKHYQCRNADVDYYYYRCSKKKQPCHQSYLSSSIFENQLRKIVYNSSLSPFAAKKFLVWANNDVAKETSATSGQVNTLTSAILNTDSKLNNLLDGYIDKTIDPLDYQKKKNELIQYKVETEEKIKEINNKGSSWLEPFSEFVKSALTAHKIARAKNNCDDLSIIAKTVGSNYFLLDKTIRPKYKNAGFLALANGAGVACATIKRPCLPDLLPGMDSNHN
ncbi:MAG: recombinase family protein [Patescibacteria group bacterium]|jgi:site-specific DNA recombinase